MDPRFAHPRYSIHRKVLKLVGGAFTVFDPSGGVVLFAEQKAFKLKEDIRLFDGPAMQRELLRIGARRAIDISAIYDVFDSETNQLIGSLQRKGVRSMLRDEWAVLDAQGMQVGEVFEDSMALALVRRFLVNLIPQNYSVTIGGTEVAEMKQQFNPFAYRIDLDFSKGRGQRVRPPARPRPRRVARRHRAAPELKSVPSAP
ncbi:MAG TPA: hypothetical protein VF230_18655 [Acidimicrobiales bacterium]